jgi:PAS domain S-box-containing protein
LSVVRGVTMQRESFRPLTENALDAIAVLNDDAIIRYESSFIEQVLGYEPGELIGKSLFEFIHPDDMPSVIHTFNDGLQIPGCIVSLEFRFQHKDSSWRNLEVIARNLVDNSAVGGIVLSFRDITARVRAEEELRQSFEKLQRTLEGTITALSVITEERDPFTAGHHQRVTRLACAMAEEMGLPEERIEGIHVAGTIHDIGKINVPTEILRKPSPLSDIEFAMMKTHPQVGHDLLKAVEFPWPVAPVVLQHHERMDGSGYPKGLAGRSILLEARILGVADVVEAMTSCRSYRSALGVDKALEEILRNKGTLYDPRAVDACLRLFAEKGFTFDGDFDTRTH